MGSSTSYFIIIITALNILACFWLIRYTSKKRKGDQTGKVETTGHTWDGDLQEYHNPLPRWWLWLFYITIVFSIIYLIIYPGMGSYQGTAKWDQIGQYDEEMQDAEQTYGPIFKAYAQKPVPELAKDASAMESGQRLFLNYCATCHGSNAEGFIGYPNLTDNDWLYGGSPEAIKTSILDGRNGAMPPMGAGMNEEQLTSITEYVLSLSGRSSDDAKVAAGKQQYDTLCVACHGADGKGNSAAGFPNLTDNIWLYGGTPGAIKESIQKGRMGKMPAHREFLGEEKSHLLAAYVFSLSLK